jgi:CheY-like chemotaxis protein
MLLDVQMPEMDGYMVAAQIQRQPEIAPRQVIMLSSIDHPQSAARLRRLGVAALLTKPMKQADLLETMLAGVGTPAPLGAPAPASHPASRSGLSAPRARILLAEDNAINQKLALRLLEKQGYAVVMVSDGRAALAALARERVDLALLDVQMPEMDGFEVTAALRARERGSGAHLPIVALTAHAMKGDRERCLAAGMDGYVAKPIDPRELFAMIEHLLGSGRVQEIFDRQAALARIDGDQELWRELIGLFLHDHPWQMAEIRRALAEGDGPGMARAAHMLKGSVGNFKAEAAFKAAQLLETRGSEGSLAQAAAAWAELEREIEQLKEVLQAELNQSA